MTSCVLLGVNHPPHLRIVRTLNSDMFCTCEWLTLIPSLQMLLLECSSLAARLSFPFSKRAGSLYSAI